MNASSTKPGMIVVISAPSGGGKGSIINQVMKHDPRLVYSISATTRDPRPGEQNGRDYLFLNQPEFEQWRDDGQFVEWAQVHDRLYGTPKAPLQELLKTGHDVVLEVDVQGMRSVRKADLGTVVTIFIEPPSIEELERRLKKRGDLTEEALQTRLRNAKEEIAAKNEFDHVVVNDDLDAAVKKVEMILENARSYAVAPRNERP